GVSNGLGYSVATDLQATGLPTDFGFFTPSSSCASACSDAFGLHSAADTVLGESVGNVVSGSGATPITGDAGVGPHDTGSLEKATINGRPSLEPTANPSVHGDLIATGGMVSK